MGGASGFWPAALRVERRWTRVFLVTLLLTAVAKGGAFLPGYSFDDYALVLLPAQPGLYSQEQFVALGLTRLLAALQVDPYHARVLFVGLSMVAIAAVGTLVARHWRLARGRWLPVVAAALVANHPFTVEIFTFRSALAAFAIPMLVLAWLLVPRRWGSGSIVVGVLLFALALSVYQVVLQFAVMVLIGGALVDLTRALAAGAPDLRWLPRDVFHRRTGLLVVIACGTGLFALMTVAAARGGSPLLPSTVLGERASAIAQTLEYRFLDHNTLLGPAVQRIQQLLLALAVLAIAWCAVRARRIPGRAVLLAVAAVVLLAASVLWSVGIVAVRKVWWPAPRTMGHAGMLWAAALVVASKVPARRLRLVPAGLAAVLLLSYLGINNQALFDQSRLNLRDLLKARRIVARLEEQPGFAQVDQLAVAGSEPTYPARLATADMDMNISAFGPPYTIHWLLVEASGYVLRPADDPGLAARACTGRQPWPEPGSVRVEGRVAIVCLGD